jgi:ribose transport system permease protein/putative xylitol transport system permease protein
MSVNWLARQKSLFPILLLIGEIIVFQSLNSSFLRPENLIAIADQLALILPLALAGTFMIMMGSFDLSITSILALSGVTTALSFPSYGYNAFLLGILVGLVLGAINGLIFIIANIPSFIVTIGTMVAYQGIALILMSGGQSIQIYTMSFRSIAVAKVGGVDLMIFWSILIFLVSLYVFSQTKFGRHTYAIGANVEAARRAGINIKRQRVYSFMISGLLSAIAGIIYVAWSGQASASTGSSLLLPAVAAMVVAGNPITGGVGGPHRTLLGALILALLSNGLIILVIPVNIQTIIYGVMAVVTIAATLDRERVKFIR